MPTATFEHLPQEKKDRIIEAAINEFADYRFDDASINRIVKSAKIPRGSFYQYFSDKEDLYMLIMNKIGKEKLEVFAKHSPPWENATFFEAAYASIPAVLDWLERYPKYNQIAMHMARDNSEFIRWVVGQMQDSQRSMLEYLRQDQERGLVRKDVDLGLVLEMILPVMSSLVHRYYQEGGQQAALEKVKQAFDLIQNGLVERRA